MKTEALPPNGKYLTPKKTVLPETRGSIQRIDLPDLKLERKKTGSSKCLFCEKIITV
jgi:hypothetical protein